MAEKKFIPVKVTDREWAEKLLDGEVFMRPLYEFGAWNLKKEDKTFHYLTTTKMEQLLCPYKDRIEIHGHYGVDSISRFVTDRINGYNDEELEQYCSIIRKSWDKNADCSEHSITVWKNM